MNCGSDYAGDLDTRRKVSLIYLVYFSCGDQNYREASLCQAQRLNGWHFTEAVKEAMAVIPNTLGPKFNEDTRKTAVIVRAKYDLKSAGAAFRSHLA